MSDGRSDEWIKGFNHAMETMAFWLQFQNARVKQMLPEDGSVRVLPLAALSAAPPETMQKLVAEKPLVLTLGERVNLEKSALLGRLMRGEEVRRRPCPKHQGMMWCRWGLADFKEYECCDGTGWLRNENAESEETNP